MDKYLLKCFTLSTAVLSEKLWRGAYTLSQEEKERAEEFRIRAGRQFSITIGGISKAIFVDGLPLIVGKEDVEQCIERATKSSVHTYNHQIREGFVSLPHGGRMGVCGSVIEENGSIRTMADISSLNIRIAKQIFGVSNEIYQCIEWKKRPSILIVSKAGGGKTTFLRDLILKLSRSGTRIGLCDERYEIAAANKGTPTFEIGENTDVISGGDKVKTAEILIRTMAPQYIAFDEITEEKDALSLIKSSYMGAAVLATAHCNELADLQKRSVYRKIMEENIFDYIVEIKNNGEKRQFSLYEKGGKNDKAYGCDYDSGFVRIFGELYSQNS